MTEIISLSTGTMLKGSFRGVPFSTFDSRHPPSRRVQRLLFPGSDQVVFQDLGQLDGDIKITGLVIGDDYAIQGAKMETAFQTPGPSTLIHPWLGNIQVVLMPGPEIVYLHDELRVMRFTAIFARYTPRNPPVIDTRMTLLQQLAALRAAALALLQKLLGLASQVLSVVSYVRNFAGTVVGYFNLAISDVSGITSELIGPVAAPAIAALAGIGTVPLGVNFATAVGALLVAPSAAILKAAQPIIPTAVAPGGDTATAAAADAGITTTLLLGVAADIAATAAGVAPAPAMALMMQATVMADAIQTASDIGYTSQQDAESWLATLSAALDALAQAAMLLGSTYPQEAGTVWRAAIATKSALSADLNATIGNLPAVETINVPQPVPAWLVAQYISGDTPGQVFATYFDLIARNNVPYPWLVPAGPIETLQSA